MDSSRRRVLVLLAVLALVEPAWAFRGPSGCRLPGVAVAAGPLAENVWAMAPRPLRIQGNTLKTWNLDETSTARVQVSLKSEGRPILANVELWHTPTYIPTQCRVYSEDGKTRPIETVVETPKHPKTVAVFNEAEMQFPLEASVVDTGLDTAYASLSGEAHESIQGGRIVPYTFPGQVSKVQVLLKTEERNMKAKIEVTRGPNQVKQTYEVYTSSGYKQPFYAVIHFPGSEAHTIRIINQNEVEFPFDAWVLPYEN